jgi:hypothetical protein
VHPITFSPDETRKGDGLSNIKLVFTYIAGIQDHAGHTLYVRLTGQHGPETELPQYGEGARFSTQASAPAGTCPRLYTAQGRAVKKINAQMVFDFVNVAIVDVAERPR